MTSMEPELGSTPEDLARLVGITICEPCGTVATQGEWAIVGSVIQHGKEVEAVPREGALPAQCDVVLEMATQVCLQGRKALTGWRFFYGIGWSTDVRVRRGYGRLRRRSASACSSEVGTLFAMTGSTDPSTR
jgi:hypothetical protein